jgi:transposase
MLQVHVTEAQRQEVEAVSRQALGRVALRAQRGLLADRGYAVPQIAMIPTCGTDVVRTWWHRYLQHGVAGVADPPRSGRPPKDRQAGSIVDAQARQSPRGSGPGPACGRVARRATFLRQRLRLPLSRSSVRRALHRRGGRWARPRLAPVRQPDPQAAGKRAARAQAAHGAAQGLGHRLYLDERALPWLPLVRALGMKGRRVRSPTPGTNARPAFFGALDAVRGRWRWADQARKRARHCVACLDHLVTAYPTGRLYRAFDGAPAHTATVVARWRAAHPRVIARRRPTSAAHRDNPAERIGGLMKDAVAADRLEGSIADLVRAACRFFTDRAPHPVLLPLVA